MKTLNSILDNLSSNLKGLIKSVSKVTITTERRVIILAIKGNKIVTDVL